ncbi:MULTISPECIES: EAL domain-containing protein [unclassified Marinobacter]|uniref:EAL domain-containing protein n=1 Tax=unclassified Marinobacter TaxID=83889 RepID=UPI0026E40FFB|nr:MULTISPECIES: EAL domain-containing protein [unclassified Marinobacter]MDO6442145.1 EAL domain-containing protein [Marinobacter sp. 2_MG-2023]MDO6825089.1 EAL domain-containing protein [Marinobacter sp. 1_MG-2023]
MPRLPTRIQRFRKGSPLSFRLLAWILLFSSAFTLIASAIQIYSDYRKDLAQIDSRMLVVESGYASSLARSLWALDQKLLQTQMEGILSLPDIVHLRLRIEPDSELVMGEIPRGADTQSHRFDLIHQGEGALKLGELTVTANLDRVYEDMKVKVGIIMATQFLKTFFVSILIILVIQHFITRHLTTMANYAKDFSLANLSTPLTLDRPDTPSHRNDEIGRVTEAFNQMRERLNDDLVRQKRDAAEIHKFSKAIEQSPSSVVICDRQWRVEFANHKFTQLTGYNAKSIVGRHPGALSDDNVNNRDNRHLWQSIRLQVQRVGVWQGEVNSVRRNGERFWEQLIVTPIKNGAGDATGYLILGEDISIRKRYEQQLLRQANYDILTGLPNRMLALDRLKLALAQARRENSMVGVMFLDLDNFKHINDTLGHDAGDNLLIEAARRISSCLRGTSTVARLGGDEFLVILPGLAGPESSSQVAERILSTFAPAYFLNGQEVFVTTSIGIAIYPTDSDNSGTLLQHADAAMYQAKHQGKSSYAHFTQEMSEVSHERLQMESRLRRALELQEMELYFQPIIDTTTGSLKAAEALIRWNNPALGMIMPDRFIPLAEETGLIIPIGEWVLEQACLAAAGWKSVTGQDIGISVNVSPRQFRDSGFTKAVMGALSNAELAPEMLELEITERLLLDNSIETAEILSNLDRAGIRLSVDDFGTGYSALSYLKSYPFDTLKIDKSFVQDVMKEPEDATLVRAIINMAHSLGLSVVAEGVEDEAQTLFLRQEGCDFAQGYFYSRPLPAEEFNEWLNLNHRTST